MEDDLDLSHFASSPCMAHELEVRTSETDKSEDDFRAHEIYIVYVHVEEDSDGFRWQVRGHQLPDPLASGDEPFSSFSRACDAGRAALERVCSQFDRRPHFTWR